MVIPRNLTDESHIGLEEIINDYGIVEYFTTLFIMLDEDASQLPDRMYNAMVYKAINSICYALTIMPVLLIYLSFFIAWVFSIGFAVFLIVLICLSVSMLFREDVDFKDDVWHTACVCWVLPIVLIPMLMNDDS